MYHKLEIISNTLGPALDYLDTTKFRCEDILLKHIYTGATYLDTNTYISLSHGHTNVI